MKILEYLDNGYWIFMAILLIVLIPKLIFPHYIFSIEDVCNDKKNLCYFVLELIEKDLEVQINNLSIYIIEEPNDDFKGFYHSDYHSIYLYVDNIDSVYSFIITLVEEIHHSVFLSTKFGMKLYEEFDKKVGYVNNPLEYSAKIYARKKFRSIHKALIKCGFIKYNY